MKKLIILVSIIGATAAHYAIGQNVAGTPPANNQVKQKLTPEQRAQKSVDHLNSMVGLTEDQKTKVYNLALERAKSVDAVHAKYKGQPDKKEQAQQEIHEIRKQYRESVKALLTPEQKERLKQYHKNKNPKPGSNPEDLIDENHQQ